MKKLMLIVLFLSCSTLLFSETVMVYVVGHGRQEQENQEEEAVKEEVKDKLIVVLEGGAMDEFFENGHIVFDMGAENGKNGEFTIDEGSFPLYLAKSGGARFLLRISVQFSLEKLKDNGKRLSPASAEYDLWQVNDAKVLKKGVVPAGQIKTEEETPENTSFKLGKAVAQEALGVMTW